MAKIKDKLLTERAKIMEKEEKRKQRDNVRELPAAPPAAPRLPLTGAVAGCRN
jgi:hypothetical protein